MIERFDGRYIAINVITFMRLHDHAAYASLRFSSPAGKSKIAFRRRRSISTKRLIYLMGFICKQELAHRIERPILHSETKIETAPVLIL